MCLGEYVEKWHAQNQKRNASTICVLKPEYFTLIGDKVQIWGWGRRDILLET